MSGPNGGGGGVRVANAPLSYGAFELTVGSRFPVPEPERVLASIADAGYAGTDLGPPGYLGEGDVLRERLLDSGLGVAGGFVPIAFSDREQWDAGLSGLHHTLDLLDAAGAAEARPVLCDAGSPERLANPGRGGEDPGLWLGERRWRTLVEGIARASHVVRDRGREPVFHHHTSTYVEGVPEIERLLEDADVALLLDSGHLAVAGGDAVTGLTDWGERIEAIHLKDVRLDVLAAVKAERADTITAWQRGLFCALGDGDVDLVGFCAALAASGYAGWVVVEQDRVLEDHEAFAGARADQERNRAWLCEAVGW